MILVTEEAEMEVDGIPSPLGEVYRRRFLEFFDDGVGLATHRWTMFQELTYCEDCWLVDARVSKPRYCEHPPTPPLDVMSPFR